ncbi:hypothetical protein IQ07DRAFT_260628 [Pyrenochaeta sp. DS3sAY3a]|nr:hypothetical protein IQ07DRAFT_260628 [Pyrenochaeta sp. DS3sAY3a]
MALPTVRERGDSAASFPTWDYCRCSEHCHEGDMDTRRYALSAQGKNDHRQGVYVLFPTGNLSRQPAVGCEAYVGTSRDMHQRIFGVASTRGHWGVTRRYIVSNLPKEYRGSRLYRQSCRGGVDLNPGRFAAFDAPIPISYSFILEGIAQIIFGVYQDQGYYHNWSTPASYTLTNIIRKSLGLAEVTWEGCNSAWTLFQSVPHLNRKFDTPCGNLSCTLPPRIGIG